MWCIMTLEWTSKGLLLCRAQFVPQMVNSLTKLGMAQQLSGTSNLENRSLAIDLCGVMVLWEDRRIKELQNNPQVSLCTVVCCSTLCSSGCADCHSLVG